MEDSQDMLTIQAKTIRTTEWSKYEDLVEEVGDEDSTVIYPFRYGYQLFTYALYYAYINDITPESDTLNDADQQETNSGEIVKLSDVSSNTDFLTSMELLARIIHVEWKHNAEDDGPTPEFWDLAKTYADAGVEELHEHWDKNRELPAEDIIDTQPEFWISQLESLDRLQSPPSSDSGDMDTS
jgi:hypothetical protein